MVNTHTCIYCLKVKTPAEFGREHVLNQAFGTYTPISFTLLDERRNIYRVCEDCNNKFGRTIDDALATSTIEGVQRFLFDIKAQKFFDRKRYTKNQTVHIKNGVLQGLKVMLVFSPQRNKIVVIPAESDIGFRKEDGCYDFYSINNLPAKEVIDSKYPLHPKRIIILISENEASVVTALKDKWKQTHIPYEIYDNSEDVDVDRIATYTKEVFRSVAKIAFNYLTYFNEADVVLQACFNPIRSFIAEGIGEGQDFVFSEIITEKNTILDEPNGQAILAHIVGVEQWPDNSITASVTLFNHIHYRVFLAKHYNGLPLNINIGHLFNPFDKKIHELGHR